MFYREKNSHFDYHNTKVPWKLYTLTLSIIEQKIPRVQKVGYRR